MRKNRVVEQNRCYHLVSRLAHRAFFLDDDEKDRAVALMRRVEAEVQDSMSYCINRAISISSDPFDPSCCSRMCYVRLRRNQRQRSEKNMLKRWQMTIS